MWRNVEHGSHGENHNEEKRPEKPKVTLSEFWQLCLEQYRIAIPQLLLTLACLFGAYAIIWVLFLR